LPIARESHRASGEEQLGGKGVWKAEDSEQDVLRSNVPVGESISFFGGKL
jgi:hypothetical protein